MGYDLVIFDCDGTLVDSERIANEVFARLITAEGLPTTFDECVRRYMGRGARACLADIERELGRPVRSDILALRGAEVERRLGAELRPIPGITETLDILGRRSTLCVASSSSPDEIAFRLRSTGIDAARFAGIFSATAVPNGKPAPDVFLHAAATLGVQPARCAVVEDSTNGVRAGHAAGMFTVGFADLMPPATLTAAGADVVVTDAAHIPDALATNGS